MAPAAPCPRCRAARLSVIYYDANDVPIGGHVQCPECGPFHAARLVPTEKADETRRRLLERKAS